MNVGNLRNRLLISMFLGVLVFAGLLAYGDFKEVAKSLGDFRWELFPLILLVTCGNYALRFVKWEYYLRVIGVQAEASPAAYQSWRQRQVVEAPNRTFAEGLSTGIGFALPQAILQEHLDDFLLVSEDEILRAMVWMIERAHTLAESAGAAALAAAYRLRDDLRGKRVGLVCSGGNTSLDHLRRALDQMQNA